MSWLRIFKGYRTLKNEHEKALDKIGMLQGRLTIAKSNTNPFISYVELKNTTKHDCRHGIESASLVAAEQMGVKLLEEGYLQVAVEITDKFDETVLESSIKIVR